MGSQSSAKVWLSLSVNATNYEDTLQYTSTVGTYATDVGPIASSIWVYLYNIQGSLATPSTTFKWINGLVRIDDVTAPRTPYGAYTTNNGPGVNQGAPTATFQENQHFRYNFHLGPFDFTDQASLASALSAQVAQAVAFTPNY